MNEVLAAKEAHFASWDVQKVTFRAVQATSSRFVWRIVMIAFMLSLHSLFVSSDRANVWYEFYKNVAELYSDVGEKPLSPAIQLVLFLVGLIGLGSQLSHELKKFKPLY